jgi:heptosyltransferase-1
MPACLPGSPNASPSANDAGLLNPQSSAFIPGLDCLSLKILILKPSSLGDIIQALPVLRLLKDHLPSSRIYWWIESGLAPLLENDPDLTGLVRFERDRWASPLNWRGMWRSIQWMRSQHFDWVIDLQSLARSAFFAWLANGKFTIGLDDPREGARGFYDITVRRNSFHTHAVDWYLDVLRWLQIPVHFQFEWIKPKPDAAAAIGKKWPANGARWVAVQPGARWPTKKWPAENYARALTQLAAQYSDLHFVVLGAPADKELGQRLAATNPSRCLDLTGRTSLPELIEWIRRCDLLLTNDTGPMHMAAALGTPLVAVFGPTEPKRTGPYRQLQNVLQKQLPCAPCLKSHCRNPIPLECLHAVTPDQLIASARRLLET